MTRSALTFEPPAPEASPPPPRAKNDQQIMHERAIDELLSQITARRLPQPVRWHLFNNDSKRKWRFDLAIVDYRIALECEGRLSRTRPEDMRAECEKHVHASLEGWLVFRIERTLIDDGTAVDLLTKMLRVKGWRPGDQPRPAGVTVSAPQQVRGAIWRHDCPTCGPASFFRGSACVSCGYEFKSEPRPNRRGGRKKYFL